MANEQLRAKRYRIPENFIDESRLFKGTVRTRFFLEGCIMALFMAIPAFMIPAATRNTRISIVVIMCGIPLLLGIVGINGDPISVVVRSAVRWVKSRSVMLYNDETIALKTAPLTALMNEKRASDAIIDVVENIKASRQEKMESEVYERGVTFEFAEDPYLRDLYADQLESGYDEEAPAEDDDELLSGFVLEDEKIEVI